MGQCYLQPLQQLFFPSVPSESPGLWLLISTKLMVSLPHSDSFAIPSLPNDFRMRKVTMGKVLFSFLA
jgi:hypothetical protein